MWVAQSLNVCLWLRSWTQGCGIEPRAGHPALREAAFSFSTLPAYISFLAVSVCQINKILKISK